MANTRQSTKRAKQEKTRTDRNRKVRSTTKTALSKALGMIKEKKADAKDAYLAAIKTLSKAASKGSIPKGRASRKISRLTHLMKKTMPELLK